MPPIKLLPTSASYGGTITQRGEGHQLFVIARVQGRHRCVAAFSCQWLFGQMVVNAADRVLRAFINPISAAAVASELASLEELEIDAIADAGADEEDDNPATLCPYLTGLFMSAFRIDMGRNRLHELNLSKINAAPDRIEHRNGYSCFDVTEPGKPRYCFWFADSAPLSAIGYLRNEEDNQIDIAILRLLKECPRIDVATLATVWPKEFSKHLKDGQTAGSVKSQPSAANPSPPSPHLLAAASKVIDILSSDRRLSLPEITSRLGSLTQPGLLGLLRTELVAAKELNANGILLLKLLLAAEKSKFVDLKPWLSTDALPATSLVDLSDALRHAELLDVSFSPSLTTEILEDLVPRLPNLRHVVAFGYLNPLTTVLPLTTYLTSLPLLDAVDQSRLRTPESTSTPECLRWVEESDPPPALTVVLYAPSLEVYVKPKIPRRYGVELAHFGAEGVVHGFTRFLERLYDPDYLGSQSGCYFEMRGYFHPTCAVPVRDCITQGSQSSDMAACYAFGCLPSLIRDGRDSKIESSAGTGSLTSVPRHPGWVLVLDTKGTMPYHQPKARPGPGQIEKTLQEGLGGFDISTFMDHMMPDSVAAQHARPEPTGRGKDVWLLSPDDASRGTRSGPSRASQGLGDAPRATGNDPMPLADDAPHPEYAFERWEVLPGEKGLQPVERISVREWVGRLPAGHGRVSETLLSKCEAALARLNVTPRRSNGTWEETGPIPVEQPSVDIPPAFPMMFLREGALDGFRAMGLTSGTISVDELRAIAGEDFVL